MSVVAIVFDAMGPTNLLPFFPKNSPVRIWHGWPLGIVSRAATLIADLPNLIAEVRGALRINVGFVRDQDPGRAFALQ